MKTKLCELCSIAESVLFRIQTAATKNWIFVCKNCCIANKTENGYKYGGTWKGNRH